MDRQCRGMDRETISRDPGSGTRRQQMKETGAQLVRTAPDDSTARYGSRRRKKCFATWELRFIRRTSVLFPWWALCFSSTHIVLCKIGIV